MGLTRDRQHHTHKAYVDDEDSRFSLHMAYDILMDRTLIRVMGMGQSVHYVVEREWEDVSHVKMISDKELYDKYFLPGKDAILAQPQEEEQK